MFTSIISSLALQASLFFDKTCNISLATKGKGDGVRGSAKIISTSVTHQDVPCSLQPKGINTDRIQNMRRHEEITDIVYMSGGPTILTANHFLTINSQEFEVIDFVNYGDLDALKMVGVKLTK